MFERNIRVHRPSFSLYTCLFECICMYLCGDVCLHLCLHLFLSILLYIGVCVFVCHCFPDTFFVFVAVCVCRNNILMTLGILMKQSLFITRKQK